MLLLLLLVVLVLLPLLGLARMAWRIFVRDEEMQPGGSFGRQFLGRTKDEPKAK